MDPHPETQNTCTRTGRRYFAGNGDPNDTRTMLDFVMANKQYCWGNGYNWSGRISQVLRNQVTSQSFTVASGMQSIGESATADLQKFLDSIEKLP